MLLISAGGWVISTDERAKHDAQFMQLQPVNGFLSGDAARGFFLKSGLPPMVLGQIWELSDINKDGRLDAKEFSIAMCFIKAKLQNRELPPQLPDSLLRDPVPNSQQSIYQRPSMCMLYCEFLFHSLFLLYLFVIFCLPFRCCAL